MTTAQEAAVKTSYSLARAKLELDDHLIQTLDTINSYDGYATIWSCEGHNPLVRGYHQAYLVIAFVERRLPDILALVAKMPNPPDWEARIHMLSLDSCLACYTAEANKSIFVAVVRWPGYWASRRDFEYGCIHITNILAQREVPVDLDQNRRLNRDIRHFRLGCESSLTIDHRKT